MCLCIATITALIAILIGCVYSGLLSKWGAFALLDDLDVGRGPVFKGMAPAMHVGTPWGFTLDQMPDLAGQSFVVTGANVGLGYWTAHHLAAANASLVVLACRSMPKCRSAASAIVEATGQKGVVAMELDLSSFASVMSFAMRFKNEHSMLDSLILNAGVMMCPYGQTAEGLEMQIGTNHFGHHLLTIELLAPLEKAAAVHGVATVVAVTSNAHYSSYAAGILPSIEAMNNEKTYSRTEAYGQSKLANVLFAQELSRRWKDKGILANSAHPGAVDTELGRHIEDAVRVYGGSTVADFMKKYVSPQGYGGTWHPKDAALTQLYLAISPEVRQGRVSGRYFHPIARETRTDPHARNATLQQHLWDTTSKFIDSWKQKHVLSE
mmetsp:Transcript_113970/g.317391  ORF Transcript_113970/g.317391 Transcript_113970/m.317391 type:complete len:380 (-) Transcript_113970:47-1186(-)|eukprot:CAMPEP_0179119238 /NCGR_PEP_ID=MMETSP0796-20121207/56122_1 /TAXON_ID=73915 /ORGANISM="Pyrodinium bahamense, Strain pbaha01" /LENGTH=379 /DNA_ID=CAMNT_0020817733 /DNA_START=82 /DNA_END=1221 /DNA_ORIENTATION=+